MRPELVIRPNVAAAADAGITAEQLADTLRVATAGDYDRAVPKLNLSQRQVPILVRLPAQARQDPSLLAQLPIPTPRGPVPLSLIPI